MTSEGIIPTAFSEIKRKHKLRIESYKNRDKVWAGLAADSLYEIERTEREIVAEIEKARVSKYQPYVFISDLLGTESEAKE